MARKWAFLFSILVGTALAVPDVSRAQVGDDQCAELPSGSATISGTVTASGAPLAFTTVIASTEFPGFGPHSFSMFTGFDGTYTIEVAAPATYVVHVSPPFGQPHAPEFYDGVFTRAQATEIAVTDGQAVTGIDLTLVTGATLSGNVTADVTGDPIEAVTILATSVDDLPHVGFGATDNEGNYTIIGLAPQTYQVWFIPEQDVNNLLMEIYDGEVTFPGDPVDVTFPGVDGIDAGLAQGGRIAGTVTGPGNQPVENAGVIAFTDGPYKLGAATTDENGDYSIVVPSDTYQVFFGSDEGLSSEFYDDKLTLATADDVVVNAPQTLNDIDAQLGESGKISGRVTDANTGDGIASVFVAAYDENGVFVEGTSTDPQGDYALDSNLRTGSYRIGFEAPNREFDGSPGYADAFYSNKQALAGADPVSVTAPQETTGIDQELVPCDEAVTTTTGPTTTTVADTTTTTVSTTTSTTGDTTTTTLGTGGECGDPVAALSPVDAPDVLPRAITASDALFVLRTAVGSATCQLCICDVNDSESITASDALVVLRRAVGQAVELQCPACDS